MNRKRLQGGKKHNDDEIKNSLTKAMKIKWQKAKKNLSKRGEKL